MVTMKKIAMLAAALGLLTLGGCVSPYYYDHYGYYGYGRSYASSDPYDGYYRPYRGDGYYSDGYGYNGYRRYSDWR
jgi:hypothetical protein